MKSSSLLERCKVLKSYYTGLLSPFFCVNEIRELKESIYFLDLPEWKKDKIWEYLNGDINFEELKKIIS